MEVGVLITNGGPHSAEDWAMATARHVVIIGEGMQADKSILALKLQATVAEVLVKHYAALQDAEKQKLAADSAHLETPLEAEAEANAAIADIAEASKGTPFEAHFADAEVQNAMRYVIASHFMTAQDIERSWHLDRNPNLRA